jgi:uncharacterized membrane protein YraQ (UPF0718 family)
MDWKREWRTSVPIVAGFLVCFYLPVGAPRFDRAISEALHLVKWYAREHVVLCLVPAFFIAGAIAVFVSKESVMRYLGARANRVLAYGVASVSGSILAVCSCTVLPLFAGIYRMGAGLGPATTFLYSGPAINVLAIELTARILGLQLGIARAVGAVLFSIVIGLLMHLFFRKEELAKEEAQMLLPTPAAKRPLWQTAPFFALMVAILVFANWGKPVQAVGFWAGIYGVKWLLTGLAAAALTVVLVTWFYLRWWKLLLVAGATVAAAFSAPHTPTVPFGVGVVGLSILTSRDDGEAGEWFASTWGYAKQILPLLFFGVLIAGGLLGRPGQERG